MRTFAHKRMANGRKTIYAYKTKEDHTHRSMIDRRIMDKKIFERKMEITR